MSGVISGSSPPLVPGGGSHLPQHPPGGERRGEDRPRAGQVGELLEVAGRGGGGHRLPAWPSLAVPQRSWPARASPERVQSSLRIELFLSRGEGRPLVFPRPLWA